MAGRYTRVPKGSRLARFSVPARRLIRLRSGDEFGPGGDPVDQRRAWLSRAAPQVELGRSPRASETMGRYARLAGLFSQVRVERTGPGRTRKTLDIGAVKALRRQPTSRQRPPPGLNWTVVAGMIVQPSDGSCRVLILITVAPFTCETRIRRVREAFVRATTRNRSPRRARPLVRQRAAAKAIRPNHRMTYAVACDRHRAEPPLAWSPCW
jgi:hypothetical protein